MAIIKNSKIREMGDAEMQSKLFEFQKELNAERGMLATGGRTSNPGKISQLKKSIARIYTIAQEKKMGIVRKIKTAAAQAKPSASPAKPSAVQQAKPSVGAAAVGAQKKE